MRVRIEGHDIEGTASEVAELLKLLGAPTNLSAATLSQTASEGKTNAASPFISENQAYEVLTRRTLGATHVKMLQALYKAGDGWTTAPELQRELGLTTREFAGLLGAFGKRLSHTDGATSRSFFDQYWDHENGYNLYRLPPSVRAALSKAKVV